MALAYRNQGLTKSAVARELGMPRSTVTDFLRKEEKRRSKTVPLQYGPKDVAFSFNKKESPRVLVLDIETKFLLMEGWAMFNQNFSVDQIAEDWSIISYSAKWLDSGDIFYSDVSEKTEDDLLHELWKLLDEAHFAIAHNGRRFDLKKIRARMIARGFKPYSPVRVIDTLEIAKQEFGFTSNKLLYLTRTLCKNTQKSSHGKFAGHLLWKEFLKGNPEAIQEMREYNIIDVVSLQELFEVMAPWSTRLPQFDVFKEEIDLDEWEEDGYYYSNLGKYKQYRHKITGQYRKGRTNLLTKEQRNKLLGNIV